MNLFIEDDDGRKTVVPIVRDEISIGRNDGNLVRLTEKNVSRRHARLVREQGHFYIEDLDSFTGVRLNGEKVKGRRLVKQGDLIQISEYDLSLHADGEEGKPAALGEDDEPTFVPGKSAGAAPAHDAQAQADLKSSRHADTAVIRLSDLGKRAEAPVVELAPDKQPKLVGVQGTFRGREFPLTKSTVRIGRSEENDLGIDHPSISRRHCTLQLDKESWKVLDAESRNGVRVNGEPYAAVGLRHGDILEIGHVNFAFVAPGREYRSPAETPALGVRRAGGGSKGMFIGLAVLAAAAVVATGVLVSRHRGAADDDGVEVGTDAKAERRFALRAADEAARAHRFSDAFRNLEVARNAGATPAELKDYEQIKAESRSEDLFHDLESAASSQDWERARKLLGVLNGLPTYWGVKAGEKSAAITAGYVNHHVAAAAMMKGKDSAGCLSEAQLALSANPQSADAQSLVQTCKAPVAQAAPHPAPSKPAEAPPKAPQVAAATLAPASKGDDTAARKLIADGDQKLLAQDFAGAVALYQKALALRPSSPLLSSLYRSMGVAYTRQGNIEEGARYYRLYLPLCTNASEKAQLQKFLDDYAARQRG